MLFENVAARNGDGIIRGVWRQFCAEFCLRNHFLCPSGVRNTLWHRWVSRARRQIYIPPSYLVTEYFCYFSGGGGEEVLLKSRCLSFWSVCQSLFVQTFFSEPLNSFVFELLCTCFVVLKANFNVILSEKYFYVCTHCTLRGIAVPAQPTNALCQTIEVLLPIRVTGNSRLLGTVPVQTVTGRSWPCDGKSADGR